MLLDLLRNLFHKAQAAAPDREGNPRRAAEGHAASLRNLDRTVVDMSGILPDLLHHCVGIHRAVLLEGDAQGRRTAPAAQRILVDVVIFRHNRLDFGHNRIGRLQIEAGFGRDRKVDVAAVHIRHEFHIDFGEHERGSAEHQHRQQHNQRLMAQRHVEAFDINVFHRVDGSGDQPLIPLDRTQLDEEQRHDGQGRDQGSAHRKDNSKAHVFEKLAGHALHQGDRQEHDDGGDGRGDDRGSYDPGRLLRRFHEAASGAAHLEAALHHDNRIVNHHTDADNEAAKAHHVDGHAVNAHHDQSGKDRERHGQRNDHRRFRLAEEQKQDNHGDHHTLNQRRDNAFNVIHDGFTAVISDFDGQPKILCVQIIDHRGDLVADRNGVGALVLGNRDADIFLPVLPADRAVFFFRQLNVSHIG